jgi:hypothetical protein
MGLKNVNPNGNNVVASNLIHVNFFFGKLWKFNLELTSYVVFSIRCHDGPKREIPHIVYLTNQHWRIQSLQCKYGFILQKNKF